MCEVHALSAGGRTAFFGTLFHFVSFMLLELHAVMGSVIADDYDYDQHDDDDDNTDDNWHVI